MAKRTMTAATVRPFTQGREHYHVFRVEASGDTEVGGPYRELAHARASMTRNARKDLGKGAHITRLNDETITASEEPEMLGTMYVAALCDNAECGAACTLADDPVERWVERLDAEGVPNVVDYLRCEWWPGLDPDLAAKLHEDLPVAMHVA